MRCSTPSACSTSVTTPSASFRTSRTVTRPWAPLRVSCAPIASSSPAAASFRTRSNVRSHAARVAVSVLRALDAVIPSRATAPGGTSPLCQVHVRSCRIVMSSRPASPSARSALARTKPGSAAAAASVAAASSSGTLATTFRSARPAPSGFSTAVSTVDLAAEPNHSPLPTRIVNVSVPSSAGSGFMSMIRHQALPPQTNRPFSASAASGRSVGASAANSSGSSAGSTSWSRTAFSVARVVGESFRSNHLNECV